MKQKDIIFILVPIVIFVIAWIIFNIYHSAARSTISETQEANLVPISPNFDTETIAEIKARKKVDPLYKIPQAEPSLQEENEGSTATPSSETEEETIEEDTSL